MNDLETYIRENQDRYTRAALTRRLIEAGHDPAAVEAAWAGVAESKPAVPGVEGAEDVPAGAPESAPRGNAGIGTMLLIVVVFLGYGGAILLAGVAIRFGGVTSVLMVAYIVAMLVGLWYSVRRLLKAPTLGQGASAIGVAFAISVVIFIGLSGACFAGLAAANPPLSGGAR